MLMLFLLFSCEDEIKPLEFETISIKKEFEADIEVYIDKAKPNSEIAEKINKNIELSIANSIPISEENKSTTLEEALTAFDEDFKSFKANFEDSEQRWALAIETELLYKTETIISMGLSIYSDTGGAHGNDTIQFLNFNPETGDLLTNDNLIIDMEGFKQLAESFFLDYMKNEGSDVSEFFFGKPFQLPENIGFNDEGVVLLYNQYEIASYNQGYTEFVIPMDKARRFLKF